MIFPNYKPSSNSNSIGNNINSSFEIMSIHFKNFKINLKKYMKTLDEREKILKQEDISLKKSNVPENSFFSSEIFQNNNEEYSLIKEDIMNWFFNLSLEERMKTATVENNTAVDIFHQMNSYIKVEKNICFELLQGDCFYEENSILKKSEKQAILHPSIIFNTNNFVDNSFDNASEKIQLENSLMNYFTNKIYENKFDENYSLYKSLFLEQVMIFAIHSELDCITLSPKLLENKREFLKYFNYFSFDKSFTEMIELVSLNTNKAGNSSNLNKNTNMNNSSVNSPYAFTLPRWISTDFHPLVSFIMALIEQVIMIKFVLNYGKNLSNFSFDSLSKIKPNNSISASSIPSYAVGNLFSTNSGGVNNTYCSNAENPLHAVRDIENNLPYASLNTKNPYNSSSNINNNVNNINSNTCVYRNTSSNSNLIFSLINESKFKEFFEHRNNLIFFLATNYQKCDKFEHLVNTMDYHNDFDSDAKLLNSLDEMSSKQTPYDLIKALNITELLNAITQCGRINEIINKKNKIIEKSFKSFYINRSANYQQNLCFKSYKLFLIGKDEAETEKNFLTKYNDDLILFLDFLIFYNIELIWKREYFLYKEVYSKLWNLYTEKNAKDLLKEVESDKDLKGLCASASAGSHNSNNNNNKKNKHLKKNPNNSNGNNNSNNHNKNNANNKKPNENFNNNFNSNYHYNSFNNNNNNNTSIYNNDINNTNYNNNNYSLINNNSNSNYYYPSEELRKENFNYYRPYLIADQFFKQGVLNDPLILQKSQMTSHYKEHLITKPGKDKASRNLSLNNTNANNDNKAQLNNISSAISNSNAQKTKNPKSTSKEKKNTLLIVSEILKTIILSVVEISHSLETHNSKAADFTAEKNKLMKQKFLEAMDASNNKKDTILTVRELSSQSNMHSANIERNHEDQLTVSQMPNDITDEDILDFQNFSEFKITKMKQNIINNKEKLQDKIIKNYFAKNEDSTKSLQDSAVEVVDRNYNNNSNPNNNVTNQALKRQTCSNSLDKKSNDKIENMCASNSEESRYLRENNIKSDIEKSYKKNDLLTHSKNITKNNNIPNDFAGFNNDIKNKNKNNSNPIPSMYSIIDKKTSNDVSNITNKDDYFSRKLSSNNSPKSQEKTGNETSDKEFSLASTTLQASKSERQIVYENKESPKNSNLDTSFASNKSNKSEKNKKKKKVKQQKFYQISSKKFFTKLAQSNANATNTANASATSNKNNENTCGNNIKNIINNNNTKNINSANNSNTNTNNKLSNQLTSNKSQQHLQDNKIINNKLLINDKDSKKGYENPKEATDKDKDKDKEKSKSINMNLNNVNKEKEAMQYNNSASTSNSTNNGSKQSKKNSLKNPLQNSNFNYNNSHYAQNNSIKEITNNYSYYGIQNNKVNSLLGSKNSAGGNNMNINNIDKETQNADNSLRDEDASKITYTNNPAYENTNGNLKNILYNSNNHYNNSINNKNSIQRPHNEVTTTISNKSGLYANNSNNTYQKANYKQNDYFQNNSSQKPKNYKYNANGNPNNLLKSHSFKNQETSFNGSNNINSSYSMNFGMPTNTHSSSNLSSNNTRFQDNYNSNNSVNLGSGNGNSLNKSGYHFKAGYGINNNSPPMKHKYSFNCRDSRSGVDIEYSLNNMNKNNPKINTINPVHSQTQGQNQGQGNYKLNSNNNSINNNTNNNYMNLYASEMAANQFFSEYEKLPRKRSHNIPNNFSNAVLEQIANNNVNININFNSPLEMKFNNFMNPNSNSNIYGQLLDNHLNQMGNLNSLNFTAAAAASGLPQRFDMPNYGKFSSELHGYNFNALSNMLNMNMNLTSTNKAFGFSGNKSNNNNFNVNNNININTNSNVNANSNANASLNANVSNNNNNNFINPNNLNLSIGNNPGCNNSNFQNYDSGKVNNLYNQEYVSLTCKIHNDILDYLNDVTYVVELLKPIKINIVAHIEKLLKQFIEFDISIDIYGSFASDLSIESSDIDLKVNILKEDSENIDYETIIFSLVRFFNEKNLFESASPISTASIPIIKLVNYILLNFFY